MINPKDLRNYVIKPALSALASVGISPNKTAEDLLMATCAVESGGGTYLMQVGGPALGIFQIEPTSFDDLYKRLTADEQHIINQASSLYGSRNDLITNLMFQAIVCRLYYWHATPEPLPPDTEDGLWNYYKTYWNTLTGATTRNQFDTALKLTDIIF